MLYELADSREGLRDQFDRLALVCVKVQIGTSKAAGRIRTYTKDVAVSLEDFTINKNSMVGWDNHT